MVESCILGGYPNLRQEGPKGRMEGATARNTNRLIVLEKEAFLIARNECCYEIFNSFYRDDSTQTLTHDRDSFTLKNEYNCQITREFVGRVNVFEVPGINTRAY